MDVGCIRLFFSFFYQGQLHQCAAVHWFWHIDDEVDEDTGMWVVHLAMHRDPSSASQSYVPLISVISLDSIVRAAHLIGVCIIDKEVSPDMQSHESLDTFKHFFVNKYIDYYAFDLLHSRPPPPDPSTSSPLSRRTARS